jgi:hypothetical protein
LKKANEARAKKIADQEEADRKQLKADAEATAKKVKDLRTDVATKLKAY